MTLCCSCGATLVLNAQNIVSSVLTTLGAWQNGALSRGSKPYGAQLPGSEHVNF